MRCGGICVRGEGLNCNLEGLAGTPFFLSVVMVLQREIISVWPRAIVFLEGRFWREFNSALIPSFLGVGTRPISWFSHPIRRIFLDRAVWMQICSLPRSDPRQWEFFDEIQGSGQFAQEWKLRMMEREAASREVANR